MYIVYAPKMRFCIILYAALCIDILQKVSFMFVKTLNSNQTIKHLEFIFFYQQRINKIKRDTSTLIQNPDTKFPSTLPTRNPTDIALQIKDKNPDKIHKPTKYSYLIPSNMSHPQSRTYI